MTWSADFPADDWTKISPAQVYSRALQRIEANGKGILLLHDIQARTVEALPALLHELKRRGYHIVHVVPATPDRPKTATAPSQWIMHAHGRQIWPGSFVEAEDTTVLPAPSPASFGAAQPFDARPARVGTTARGRGVPPRPGAARRRPRLGRAVSAKPRRRWPSPAPSCRRRTRTASAIPRPRRRPGCRAGCPWWCRPSQCRRRRPTAMRWRC